MSIRTSNSSRQILETLYSRIKSAVESTSQERYRMDLRVERIDDPASKSSEITARIEGASIPGFLIRLDIHPDGTSLYDLRLRIDEGPACSFAYSPPDGSRSACGQIQMERKFLSCLLDELDRQLGNDEITIA